MTFPTNAKNININAVIARVLAAANDRRDDAAHAGSTNDGGASEMEANVAFYRHGMAGTIPPAWEQYVIENDPEYAIYERLRAKFEGTGRKS